MVTVNGNIPSTPMQRFWFYFALYLQTMFRPMYAAALLAQAKLETATFTSYGFAKRKNPFGMRPALVRPNSQDGSEGGFATYKSYWRAVKDRIQWDQYNRITVPDKASTMTALEATDGNVVGMTEADILALESVNVTPVEQYIAAVLAADYVLPEEQRGYREAWMQLYEGKDTDWMGTLATIALVGVTITIVIWLLRLMFGNKRQVKRTLGYVPNGRRSRRSIFSKMMPKRTRKT